MGRASDLWQGTNRPLKIAQCFSAGIPTPDQIKSRRDERGSGSQFESLCRPWRDLSTRTPALPSHKWLGYPQKNKQTAVAVWHGTNAVRLSKLAAAIKSKNDVLNVENSQARIVRMQPGSTRSSCRHVL